ncbi:unnamed protein product [Ambrosiozyma monospora]|uniref:Unnamed protein product n=1 Tax=Ambrosiozyma monospora TaxID=43982 RepID=A0A9W7DEI0_AMBMO|nr:unnamed protein product [Ambrosiozyma monospora]
MSEQTVDTLLTSIISSLRTTSASLDNLSSFIDESDSYPELVKSLLKASSTPASSHLEGVSLLTLKNTSLLSYINSLSLILGSRLNALDSKKSDDDWTQDKVRQQAIVNSVTQRTVLDRGVKPLEKKLTYQLEKLVAAYNRREKEQTDVEAKANEDSSDLESEEDSEEEDNALGYRPDPTALLKKSTAAASSKQI